MIPASSHPSYGQLNAYQQHISNLLAASTEKEEILLFQIGIGRTPIGVVSAEAFCAGGATTPHILVVAPALSCQQWEHGWQRWGSLNAVAGSHPDRAANVNIASLSAIGLYGQEFLAHDWDLVISDWSATLLVTTSKRYRELAQLRNEAAASWVLPDRLDPRSTFTPTSEVGQLLLATQFEPYRPEAITIVPGLRSRPSGLATRELAGVS